MISVSPIVYSSRAQFSYRHAAGVPKSTFTARLRECGLLRHRGSRGGQSTRARRAAQPISKLPHVNSRVKNPGSIPTVIGHRPAKATRSPSLNVRPAVRTAINVTERFVPCVFTANIRGGFMQKADELDAVLILPASQRRGSKRRHRVRS